MFSKYLKTLSILKKFLFINFVIFTIIGLFTIIYVNSIQANLVKKKSENHIKVITNTVDNITRLNVKFDVDDIRKFLFSTRFIFQNLDRVIFFDNNLKLIGDTDTLDLDPRSFSTRLDEIEFETLSGETNNQNIEDKNINLNQEKLVSLKDVLKDYSNSIKSGKSYTFIEENFNQFKLTTIKNVERDGSNVGYLAITEIANDIKTATNERKAFVIRTAVFVGFVILIFSFVLSRYFIKPIQNLVQYTKHIKEKNETQSNIENLKNRNDELGLLSSSLEDMTNELKKRVTHAENFSTDLVHEIRNPLASLKSASEILQDTNDRDQRIKLIDILSHDVQRIERLITDYSQMLKDEVALSKEKMNKINIEPIIQSVVDDYNNIHKVRKDIDVKYENDGKKEYLINGIENRIEQIIANLLDNSISFSKKGSKIFINVSNTPENEVSVKILDEGEGFKEKDTSKIFNRFYSNRPDKFGEHSGLGLNIVKNLVDLHDGEIEASNRINNIGAMIEIRFPSI
ncbi:HAMP domain-containing histidine kinase [Pelagibacterales bacterium SAG-MED45]|jgi:two-component system sensor histidine kinase ChvG|nr:HAMP domain-containing histidine kinase [Pelagibacterales bacterium SAG-MED45]